MNNVATIVSSIYDALHRNKADAGCGFPELQPRFFKDFGGGLCYGSIIGQEPVSIVHFTRPECSMKRPIQN